MWNGIAIGIGRSSFAGSFAGSYATRVTADGGVVEALSCLNYIPNPLDNASLLIIPSGYKADVAYAELPANGNGDLTWSRNSVANRTQSDGNIGSVAANVPRLSYMYGSCPALLLEPQRTNSLRNSTMQGAVAGTPGTLPTNWGISATAGLSTSVVGVGTENGLPYVDVRINGTANATGYQLRYESTTTIVASVGQVWTGTSYIKKIAESAPPLSYRTYISEHNASGVELGGSSVIVNPSTSLQRFAQTRTLTNASTARVLFSFLSLLTNGATYDFTIRIAAPQMELGAYATTWINTTNAEATRLADSFTRNNIYTNGLISASGGTWFVELRNNVAYTRDTFTNGLYISDATTPTNNNINIRTGPATTRLIIHKVIAGVNTALYTTTTDTVKLAIKWNGTSADIFQNGVKVVSATAFTPTNMEFLRGDLTQVPVFIQQMALWPTPLSDAQCQALTT